MSDKDLLADLFPRARPFRFADLSWPPWDAAIYDPAYQGQHYLACLAGANYVYRNLTSERSSQLSLRLSSSSTSFLDKFNSKIDVEEYGAIIARDQSMLASFQSGAIYAIGKLRAAMGEQLSQGELGDYVKALEANVHQQFVARAYDIGTITAEVQASDALKKLVELQNMKLESDDEDVSVDGQEADNVVDDIASQDKNQDGEDAKVVEEEDNQGKSRNRAKSKRAKKLKKKALKGAKQADVKGTGEK